MATTPNEFIEFSVPGNIPSTPDANKYRLYLKADGTQLHMKDDLGAIVSLAASAPVATNVGALGAQAALAAVDDPADAPATADALRDDLVANTIADLVARDAALKVSVDALQAKLDALIAALLAAGLTA